MSIANNVKIFLTEKLKEVDRKNFAADSGIVYNTITKLLKEESQNPDLDTLLYIAKSCNCTIDEVIGRKDYYKESQNYKFKDMSLEEAVLNLKSFINIKLKEKQLEDKKYTLKKLSKELDFSVSTIPAFIKGKTKILGTAAIIALADDSEISIDEMIGRVSQ